MVLRGMMLEDMVNYKKISTYLIFPFCTFKCDKDNGCKVCQNRHLADDPKLIVIPTIEVCKQFVANPLAKAIVCAGLEPLDSIDDIIELIETLRYTLKDNSDIVIYTGYTEEEVLADEKKKLITTYPNIVVKYGRFIMNDKSHYDEALGVKLASSNQYAKRYNFDED